LLVLSGLRLLVPGDTQWINDEPLFLAKAAALRAGTSFESAGLRGALGLTYGPVAVWIYTALLSLSQNLLHVVLLRTALYSVLLVLGLVWLGRLSARLRPIMAPLLLLSPYAWLYSRQIWDNTWLIPLGTIGLAAYVSFCEHAECKRLWAAVVTM